MKKRYISIIMTAAMLLINCSPVYAIEADLSDTEEIKAEVSVYDDAGLIVEEIPDRISDNELTESEIYEASDAYEGYGNVDKVQAGEEYGDDIPDTVNGFVLPPNYRDPAATVREKGRLKTGNLERRYVNEVFLNSVSLRNQSPYGTCWAFSSIGMAEFSLLSQKKVSSADLSELHLAYFGYYPVVDPLGLTEGDQPEILDIIRSRGLDQGGNYMFASNAFAGWFGAADEETAPYAQEAKRIHEGGALDPGIAFKDTAYLKDNYRISISNNPDGLKELIKKYGGACVSMYASNGLAAESGDYYNPKTNSYYCDQEWSANHAVMIVGWDDDYSASNFKGSPAGNGAWLIRNSWTTGNYSDNQSYSGYFWMSYYDKGLMDEANVFVFDTTDDYDNNYHYDGGIVTGWIDDVSGAANIFTSVKDKETLKAVSFDIESADSDYTLKIYTGIREGGGPEDGVLVSQQQGSTTYAGRYTVDLYSPVELNRGDRFSVVISFDELEDIGVEYKDYEEGYLVANAAISQGQSYCLKTYPTHEEWWDVGENDLAEELGNVRISALTAENTVYNITYNSGIGVNDAKNPTEYAKHETVDIYDAQAPTGYTFDGWFAEGINDRITSLPAYDDSSRLKYGDYKLTAKYHKNKYLVKYDSNGGFGLMEDSIAEYGTPFDLLPNGYTRDGYDFDGWNTKKDGTGNSYADGQEVSNLTEKDMDTVILYAQWKDAYEEENESEFGDLKEGTPQYARYVALGKPGRCWIYRDETGNYTYTGDAIKPYTEVYFGTKKLTEGTDYTLSYKNNKAAFTSEDQANKPASKRPAVAVTLTGNYTGTKVDNFLIAPIDISNYRNILAPDVTVKYNNKVQKVKTPVTVTLPGGKSVTLKEGTDYSITWEGGDNAFKAQGEYTATINGKGNYKGRKIYKVKIVDTIPISRAKVVKISNVVYTGRDVLPTVELKLNKRRLVEGEDYVLEYCDDGDHVNIGTVYFRIRGIGDFDGAIIKTFKITGISMGKVTLPNMGTSAYSGLPIEIAGPEGESGADNGLKLSYRANKKAAPVNLTKGVDYTVSYKNNVKAGKATVVFTGRGKYYGTVSAKFTIAPRAYSANGETGIRVALTSQSYPYSKGGVCPEIRVTYNNPARADAAETLEKDRDYTVKYKNYKAVNSGTVLKKRPCAEVTFKGNFKGKTTVYYTIGKQRLSETRLYVYDQIYTGKAGNYKTKVKITDKDGKELKAGRDYDKTFKVYYKDDTILEQGGFRAAKSEVQKNDLIRVGTVLKAVVTGKGSYEGEVSAFYRLVRADLGKATASIAAKEYTGSRITLADTDRIIIKTKKNKTDLLVRGRDYYIAGYSNNVNKGTAKVTIVGIGNYGGTKTFSFKIKAREG